MIILSKYIQLIVYLLIQEQAQLTCQQYNTNKKREEIKLKGNMTKICFRRDIVFS